MTAPASTLPVPLSDLWAVVEAAGTGILVTDARRRIVFVNSTFTQETGYGLDEVLGRSCTFLQGPGTDPQDLKAMREALDRAEAVDRVVLNYHKGGWPLRYRLRIRPVFVEGTLRYFVGVQEDYSAMHAAQEHLQTLAYLDSLTPLGNRRAFDADLNRLCAEGAPFELTLIDLNDFKQVNDQRGHPAGDRLLQQVAHTLKASLPAAATAYRVGGDEFAALLPGEHAQAAPAICELLGALGSLEGGTLRVGLGWASCPQEAAGPEELLRLADARMYADKAQAKGGEAPSRRGRITGAGAPRLTGQVD